MIGFDRSSQCLGCDTERGAKEPTMQANGKTVAAIAETALVVTSIVRTGLGLV